MGKFWFYLKPYCFVWAKGKTCLIYDSHSGKGIELKNTKRIQWLINQLNDLNNLYCIELSENLLKKNGVGIFISKIQDSGSGNLIPVVPGKRKPAFLVPFLNLQQDINKLRKEPERSLGKDIMKNLHEISIFINANNVQNSNVFEQFIYQNCIEGNLLTSDIISFLRQIRTSFVNIINVYADNFLKHPDLGPLINELDKMNIIKNFCLPLGCFPANISELEFLESPHCRLTVLVEPGFVPQLLIDASRKLNLTSIQVEWVFAVSSKREFTKVNSIILKSNLESVEIKPFFNGKNLKFFKENVFLTKEDLLNSGLSKREVFAHQVLNTNDFGKFTIFPDRKVYANINHPPLGLIAEPVNQMVFSEMDKGTSWRRIRDMEPCCNCVYQWLCPSPSNYEIAIGKPNLCHVM